MQVDAEFDFDYRELCDITENKSSAAFVEKFVDPHHVVKLLHSNTESGLIGVIDPISPINQNGDVDHQFGSDLHVKRRRLFGINTLPPVKGRTFLELCWIALQDKILILLCVAAIVSLAVGFYRDFKPNDDPNPEPKTHWIEGLAIVVAICIVVLASSINNYQKEKQFRKLNAKKEDRKVKVLRDEHIKQISVYHILVGDILLLEPGDVTSADGVIVSLMNLKIDESAATGESDMIKKTLHGDCFILSGSKVNEGIGRYIVTAVGENSYFGKTLMALRTEDEGTPLQVKLDHLAEKIAKLGLSAALIMLISLILKYVIGTILSGGFGGGEGQETTEQIIQQILTIFISVVTVIVVAIPEGLPLAVTLALAYATRRMMDDNNLVRVLSACETMGGATTICSDKTGTLTQNKMTVVQGVFAKSIVFTSQKEIDDLPKKIELLSETTTACISNMSSGHIPIQTFFNVLIESIALNSSAFEEKTSNNTLEFSGSKTEVALLEFVKRFGIDFEVLRKDPQNKVVQIYPFSSERKTMATLLKVSELSKSNHRNVPLYRMHVKGASEIVLGLCDKIVVSTKETTSILPLDANRSKMYNAVINSFAEEALRTICLAYKDFTEEELQKWLNGPIRQRIADIKLEENSAESPHCLTHADLIKALTDDVHQVVEEPITDNEVISHQEGMKDLCTGMTCLGIVGIEDPLRDGVKEAVHACQKAGVFVRMVTGDNVVTAKAIAIKCGIYSDGGAVMEGSEFRKLSEAEMDFIIPRLQVLARSSPTDKQLLVGRLKALGETVAVTGDGTNDGPALKMADIGFSMGITGTEVAKEASSIILMYAIILVRHSELRDDNFASIVKAMMWGRSVVDSVKKFLQFQLTVNISAVTLAFVSSVSDFNESSVLSAVQLLWINLIMNTLAALALATDLPQRSILDRPPQNKRAPLISFYMWKMILFQASFQITVGLGLFFGGPSLFNLDRFAEAGGFITVKEDSFDELLRNERLIMRTIIFNTFVFMQIFNEVNCRVIDSKLNIFKGILDNNFFLPISAFIITAQIILIIFGASAFKTTPLTGTQWAACILIGSFSLVWGIVIRLLPDDLFFFHTNDKNGYMVSEALPLYRMTRANSSQVRESEITNQSSLNTFNAVHAPRPVSIRANSVSSLERAKLAHPKSHLSREI